MKKILMSVAMLVVVGAAVAGATGAFFSDTETSTGNTFTAGTIDISVNEMNPWNESFVLADMKPSYTDYINLRIDNDGSDANPVNIYKLLDVTLEETGTQSEPECTEESGTWDNSSKVCSTPSHENNDLSGSIIYDMDVEVYDAGDVKIWHQTIYVDGDGYTIDDVYYGTNSYDEQAFLGMIPAGGYMLVEQSYHLDSVTTNWAQGDEMTFSIQLTAEQLHGEAWLENKDATDDLWKIIHGDGIEGTLTYTTKHPTFDFSFTGTAPVASHNYDLVVITDLANDTGVLVGSGTSDGSGNITITGDMDTGDMKDAKVWLVTAGHVNPATAPQSQ
ncbi:TasA family protein [Patescibacteria group bacterium]